MTGAGESPRQRLFVGLAPCPGEARALARQVAALDHGGRPVPAENLHLTLVFLGSLAGAAAADARGALSGVTGEAFELRLHEVGFFPRPRVLWCAQAAAPTALLGLQARVAHALSLAGLTLESRPFSPHVTVARKVARYRGPGELAQAVTWRLREFRLVASRTLPAGACHETVQAYGLQD